MLIKDIVGKCPLGAKNNGQSFYHRKSHKLALDNIFHKVGKGTNSKYLTSYSLLLDCIKTCQNLKTVK